MAPSISSRRLPGISLALAFLGLTLAFSSTAQEPSSAPSGEGFSNYQNTPVNSILDIYEQLSGKHLVRDTNLAGVPNISINATGVSKAEMLKLIETTLLLNGVAIVSIDEHTAKVVTIGTNKNPRSEGVKLYANAAELPADEEVVSYYMPLDYISAQEAQTIFTGAAPVHPGYGAYTVAPSAQAVVLTENTSVIRQLIALKELIDVPPARVVTEFIQLDRADAEKVADLLTNLLNPKAGTGAAPPAAAGTGGAAIVPADVGNNAPVSNEHSLFSGAVQIVPDTRSNRLLVVTRPVNMPLLRQIVAELDQNDTFALPQRRDLKYVLAQDILPALEAAVAQGKDEEEQVQKDLAGSGTTHNQGGTSQSQANPTTTTTGNGTTSGGGVVAAVTSPLETPQQNNVPTVVSIGKTRILADNRSNSIIVFGSNDSIERVFAMIDQLDRKPLQVYLATVIGELTVSDNFEFGIDLLQKFQHGVASGLVTPNTAATGSTLVPEPSSLLSSTGFPLVSGLTIYGAIGNTLDAYVRALDSTENFKIISRPSVYTTNNTKAVIASGQQVPVPSNTTSGFTGTSTNLVTTASITYEDVLLQLEIIPLINANHQVTLKIRQTNNTLGANTLISGNEIPAILTQEINTEVTVPDKSTIVIGGLISDSNKRTTSGIPWLSDIPLLGYLFKDTTKDKERDELIIMIQPTVVETDTDQIAVNEAEKRRTILGQDAISAAGTPATSTTTTTTTTVTVKPPGASVAQPSIVPAASSPAPDVGRGMPTDAPAPPSKY
jgi:type II secretion system protein D